jgi:hypothetical protein
MVEHVLFRQVTIQTATITGPVLELLTDSGTSEPRATDDSEGVVVQWLIDQPIVRAVMLQELRRPSNSITKAGVIAPLIENPRSKPGDIDLFICSPDRPQEALVVEWKRVKVTLEDQGNNRVNKLGDIEGGVNQAKALRELGFYQTYFGILTVVDAAEQTHWNVPNRGIDPTTASNYTGTKTFKSIVEFPRREELRQDIGILFIELVQPTRRALRDLFTVRICVHRHSMPQSPRNNTNNRVVAYLNQLGVQVT